MFNLFKKVNKTLTIGMIDKLADSELVFAVFEDINKKVEEDSKEMMSQAQQAFYVMWILEAEVNNGGFNQFYFNKSIQLAELAIDGFKLFGATKYAELTKKSLEVFISIRDDLKSKYDGTVLSFSKSYNDNPLNEFDEKFYELEKEQSLESIMASYIRKNPKQFI